MQSNFSPLNAHYILNPNSGRFRKNEARFETLFNHYQIPNQHIHLTKGSGDATRISRELSAQSSSLIFAIGGDGTVNETASGILGSDSVLGIIPMGSGNGFARHLKIPLRPESIMAQLASAKVITVDVGYCNDRPFYVTSSIGLSAKIAHLFDQFGSRGPLPYFLLTTKTFFSIGEFAFRMELDGKIIEGLAMDITIANANQFGNGAFIAPNASMEDGLFDIAIVRKPGLVKAPILAKRLFDGRIMERAESTHLRGEEVNIYIESGEIQGHIDGEPVLFNSSTLHWHLSPAKLKVISF